MIVYSVVAVASAFVVVSFLMLCLTKKKKKDKPTAITTLSYSQRPQTLNDDIDSEAGLINSNSTNSQSSKEPIRNGDKRRSASQVSQSRVLPQLPMVISDENRDSWRSSNHPTTDSVGDAASAGGEDSPDTRHSSPRGRRLPAPPPEGETPIQQRQSITLNLQDDDDNDMYASVDGPAQEIPARLKIKTLEIPEGSGDSSFYAKVGESEDTDLYAQVDDPTVKDFTPQSNKPTAENAQASTSVGTPTLPQNADSPIDPNYSSAEYATIDKMKKTSLKRKPGASNEPPAPPIPERNFEDEEEQVQDVGPPVVEEPPVQDEPSEPPSSVQGPMYDKLCVRESLDHLRLRHEVEQERKLRYANITVESDINPADDYAQIEETNPESVYESVSVNGSADGVFTGNHLNGYASIETPETLVHNPTPDTRQQMRRPHHYEQIERPPVS